MMANDISITYASVTPERWEDLEKLFGPSGAHLCPKGVRPRWVK